MNSDKDSRKRKASTKLMESNEALVKKLCQTGNSRLTVDSTRLGSGTTSTCNVSQQPSASSLRSQHTTPPQSPSPSENNDGDHDPVLDTSGDEGSHHAIDVDGEGDDGELEDEGEDADPQKKLGMLSRLLCRTRLI